MDPPVPPLRWPEPNEDNHLRRRFLGVEKGLVVGEVLTDTYVNDRFAGRVDVFLLNLVWEKLRVRESGKGWILTLVTLPHLLGPS